MSDWLGRLRAAWENLSVREQLLLGGAVATAAIVVLWLSVVSPLLAMGDRASAGAEGAEQQLEMMLRLRRDYDEVTSRLASVEQRIKAKGQNRNVLTLLDSLAAASGVKIESMEERQAASNDLYRETKVEVALRGVTLSQLVSYLHNVEQSPQLLSVKSLRVKSRGDAQGSPDEKLLDVTFAVSSFEPI